MPTRKMSLRAVTLPPPGGPSKRVGRQPGHFSEEWSAGDLARECPRCGSSEVTSQFRTRLLDYVAALLLLKPLVCSACWHSFHGR
jgi:hypothetical protein